MIPSISHIGKAERMTESLLSVGLRWTDTLQRGAVARMRACVRVTTVDSKLREFVWSLIRVVRDDVL